MVATFKVVSGDFTVEDRHSGGVEKVAEDAELETHAYLTGANNSNELVAQERNPFRLNVEWQWIPKSRHGGLFLRNLDTQEYLCFDHQGKPVVQKDLDFESCLLVVSLPPLKLFGLENASYPKGQAPMIQPPWPVRIKPAKAKQQVWRLGFCHNGHPFPNGNPEQDACTAWQLPRWWDIVVMCPVIPDRCWTVACMSESLTYESLINDFTSCNLGQLLTVAELTGRQIQTSPKSSSEDNITTLGLSVLTTSVSSFKLLLQMHLAVKCILCSRAYQLFIEARKLYHTGLFNQHYVISFSQLS
nr:hypothetical protein HmN_000558200 [Hymenolepis microstoma]